MIRHIAFLGALLAAAPSFGMGNANVKPPTLTTAYSAPSSIGADASPPAGATLSGVAPISFSIDTQHFVIGQAKVNGVSVGTPTLSGGKFSVSLDTTQLANGPITLNLAAWDKPSGDTLSWSGSIAYVVNNAPATMAITAPGAGATVGGTTAVAVAVPASISPAIVNVTLDIDGVRLANGGDQAPANGVATFSWPTSAYANGAHSLVATGWNVPPGGSNSGNPVVAPTLNVTVANSAPAPAGDGVSIVHPDPVNPQKAVPMSAFLDSFGFSGNYMDPAKLNYMGIHNFRGGAITAGVTQQGAINIPGLISIANALTPVKGKLVYGVDPHSTLVMSTFVGQLEQLKQAGVLLAVDGWNEPDSNGWQCKYNKGGTVLTGGFTGSWQACGTLSADTVAAVAADPILVGTPVFSVSHVGAETDNVGLQFCTVPSSASGTLFPAGTKFCDYAAAHNYTIPHGQTAPFRNAGWYSSFPGQHISQFNQYTFDYDFVSTWSKHYPGYSYAQLPSIPRVATETGWYGLTPDSATQGKIDMDVIVSSYMQGVDKTFLYELQDECSGDGCIFGMYDGAGNLRQAGQFIHNLTTILADTGGPASLGSVPWTLPGGVPADPDHPAYSLLHAFLAQKSSGRYDLIVSYQQTPAATFNGTFGLGGTWAHVNVFDPTVGTAPISSASNVSAVTLGLTDHLQIIEFYN